MGTGLFVLGIIFLLLLLILGILMIVYKDRISSTNPNTPLIIGIILIVLSVILLILLIASYARDKKRKTSTTFIESTVIQPAKVEPCLKAPENYQIQTNQPVMITVSPLRQNKIITSSCVTPIITNVPKQSTVINTNTYPNTVPVTIIPNTNTEQIIGTI